MSKAPDVRVARKTTRNSRIYTIDIAREGEAVEQHKLISVTSMQRALRQEWMKYWAGREVATLCVDQGPERLRDDLKQFGRDQVISDLAGAPDRKSGKGRMLGTAVHDLIEHRIMGGEPPDLSKVSEDGVALAEAHVRWFDRFCEDYRPEWEMCEATGYHLQHQWAGTLDAICKIGGQRVLLDVKTNNPRRDGTAAVYPENALQLAIYRHAEYVAVGRGQWAPMLEMPQVDLCAVLWLNDSIEYALVEVDASPEVYKVCRHLAKVSDWVREGSKTSVRDELTPGSLGVVPEVTR